MCALPPGVLIPDLIRMGSPHVMATLHCSIARACRQAMCCQDDVCAASPCQAKHLPTDCEAAENTQRVSSSSRSKVHSMTTQNIEKAL